MKEREEVKESQDVINKWMSVCVLPLSFLDELQNLMSEDVFLANIFPILEDYVS